MRHNAGFRVIDAIARFRADGNLFGVVTGRDKIGSYKAFAKDKRFGFEEVPALGEEFDPELHNAVMREAGDEPGKILEVFQKGYKVKDRVIRYAMVKVSVE